MAFNITSDYDDLLNCSGLTKRKIINKKNTGAGTMENPFEKIDQRLRNIEQFLQQIHAGSYEQVKNPGTYLKIDKAAEFLSTTPNALRVMVNKNQIPFIKKHGRLFFRERDLVEWLEGSDFLMK